MTIQELIPIIEAENSTPDLPSDRDITSGYACDLLSWVMAHGMPGMAWITVQTHLNVIAVAVLMEFTCVILPENTQMEEPSLRKAKDEGIIVLRSPLTAYELCARMAASGLGAAPMEKK